MGVKYQDWHALSISKPQSYQDIIKLVLDHRDKSSIPDKAYQDPCLIELCQTIYNIMRDNKHILLYADYDVDGTMSCVLWVWFFQAVGYQNYDYYIPSRQDLGYGVHLSVLERFAKEKSTKLVITMDTGVTAKSEAEWCYENDIIFIATDHHDIQVTELPSHGFMLNPKLHQNKQYHTLCGCGVTFIAIERFISQHKIAIDSSWFLDALAVTAFATVCDVMPFDAGNRAIVKSGLAAFNSSTKLILSSLREQIVGDRPIKASDFAFKIGPLINSAGRIDNARIIVEYFTQLNDQKSIEQALVHLRQLNAKRKEIEQGHFDTACSLVEKDNSSSVIFLGHQKWHSGVLGIVASKLSEKYHKPTWLFTKHDDMCRGSARSPCFQLIDQEGFDLCAAMASASDLFDRYGGHRMAAGFSFFVKDGIEIKQRIIEYGNKQFEKSSQMWNSKIGYDCELDSKLLTLDLADQLSTIEPFGHKFELPIFRITAKINYFRHYQCKVSGDLAHTAVYLEFGELSTDKTSKNSKPELIKVMFFNRVLNDISKDRHISCLVTVARSSFRGNDYLDLTGIDYQLM